MLKKCYGLFLGLVVLAGSACVTPTHASSASVVITNIRAGGAETALEEGIVLYNNSSFEIVVNDWCLTNKALVKFTCIVSTDDEQIVLPAYSYATIVSESAAINMQPGAYAAVYESVNHSSGAIVASSDTVSLLDSTGQLVDQYSWTSSLSSTQQWSRMKLTAAPDIFLDNNSPSDWQKQIYGSFPVSQLEYRFTDEEVDEPLDPEIPDESTEPATLLFPIITEILPNAVGSDTGSEFIELYNPNEFNSISLEGYILSVGPALEKKFILGAYILQPNEYKVFTNAEYSYSLLNTSSKVSLSTSQDIITSDVPMYDSPADGEAWALVDEVWQYTNIPTPGTVNMLSSSLEETEDKNEEVAIVKPCAENQYRSSETNRCRLISTSTSSTPAACKVGQERNPETNRCRNITSSNAAACKEGQERNPDTNRCRNNKTLTKTDFGVKGVSTQQQSGLGWYMWAAIGGVVVLIIGYGVWEWRDELKRLYAHIKAKFAGTAN